MSDTEDPFIPDSYEEFAALFPEVPDGVTLLTDVPPCPLGEECAYYPTAERHYAVFAHLFNTLQECYQAIKLLRAHGDNLEATKLEIPLHQTLNALLDFGVSNGFIHPNADDS